MGKSSSFLLSPFTSLNGEAYQVIGNLGILACIVALHAGAVAVVTWRRRNSFADTVKLEKRSQPSQRDGQTIPASSSSLLPPEAVLQFPNLSFVAALLLAPGVVRTIPLLISASGEGSSVALQLTVGVIAIVALSVGVYWRAWLVVSTPLFSRLRFVPYRRSELDSVRLFNGSTSPVPRLLLPTGRWEPEIARRCYGRLRGAVHGGAVRWSMFRPCSQLLLCVLTGVPVPLSWCTGYWIVLCTVQAAVAVFVVVERPSRARFTDILLALQMLISCATTASCAGVPHVSEDVVTVLMMAAVIFSSLQMVHVAIVFRWEARALQASGLEETLAVAKSLKTPNIQLHHQKSRRAIDAAAQRASNHSIVSTSTTFESNDSLTNLSTLVEMISYTRHISHQNIGTPLPPHHLQIDELTSNLLWLR